MTRLVLLTLYLNNMNIKEMSLEALKALAYDQLALLEQTQVNLRLINEEIAEKSKAPSQNETTEVKEEVND